MADHRILRYEEYARAMLDFIEEPNEVSRHRAQVVGHEYSIRARCSPQYFRIVNSFQFCFNGSDEIHAGFAKAGTGNNREIQVGIPEETDAHSLISLIQAQAAHYAATDHSKRTLRFAANSNTPEVHFARRACSSFSQRLGFASLRGIADASKSCCFFLRY